METAGKETASRRKFVSFRIEDYLMGMDILQIREINRFLDITPVQNAPEFIRGLLNLRGQVVTVFDVGLKIGLSKRELSPMSHNIIFKYTDAGFLVDSIGDVVDVPENMIERPPANMSPHMARYVEAVARLDEELFIILSAENILAKADGEADPEEST